LQVKLQIWRKEKLTKMFLFCVICVKKVPRNLNKEKYVRDKERNVKI